MGLLDTVKGWFGGHKEEVKSGIDKGADAAKSAVPDEHDAKIDQAADAAKDAVDKID